MSTTHQVPASHDPARLNAAAAIYEANAVYWAKQRGAQAEQFADFNRKTAAELRERAAAC